MMAFTYCKLFSRYVGSGHGPETYGPFCERGRRCDFMCRVDKPKRENQSLPQTRSVNYCQACRHTKHRPWLQHDENNYYFGPLKLSLPLLHNVQ